MTGFWVGVAIFIISFCLIGIWDYDPVLRPRNPIAGPIIKHLSFHTHFTPIIIKDADGIYEIDVLNRVLIPFLISVIVCILSGWLLFLLWKISGGMQKYFAYWIFIAGIVIMYFAITAIPIELFFDKV